MPLLLLFAAARLQAQKPSPEEIDALMAQSGLQGQIANLASQFEQAVLQQDSGLDPKRVAVLRKANATAFAVDRRSAQVREFLQSRVTHEDVEQVTQWYSSPLGAKIRALEKKAGGPEKYLAMQGDLTKIVGAERLARIQRLETAIEGTEAALVWYQRLGASTNKIRLLLWGLDPAAAGDPADRTAELKPIIQRGGILLRADTLRGLTIEELDRYVAFAESPAARHWHRAMWDAIELVLTKGLDEVGAAMAQKP